MLETLVALLVASVIFVPLSRRLGLGSVLGYLVAGAAIGPLGLGLVSDVERIAEVSELGVVMLLFLIGLELRPQRLWVLRRSVFGLGTAQVIASTAVLAAILHWTGIAWNGAVVLGAGLSLSSTAIVLPMLAERDLLGSRAGRDGFAVLLFQDLAFIPLVALVPLLADSAPHMGAVVEANRHVDVPWRAVAQAVAAVAVILVGGRFLVPQVFRLIGGARTPEVFTATTLMIVAATAFLAEKAGLSMSLGAFLAGVLLSGSEYRHELQADIEPFEGLLLGFFFMSVGMEAQLGLVAAEPRLMLIGVAVLLAAKVAISFLLSRVLGRRDAPTALRFALAIPQGSEFSFVMFGVAVGVGALAQHEADRATLVIAVSMAATPVLFALSERFLVPRIGPRAREPQYDAIPNENVPVIICGFGRVGQIVGRILLGQGIKFTALEQDPAQIEVVRRFGSKVYFGNATRPDLLRAAGAETAKVLVVALDDREGALRLVEIARRNFPNLQIVARARNRRHAHLLMNRGVAAIVRETFHSSLHMAGLVLEELGTPEADAAHIVDLFRAYDERNLVEALAFYEDEHQLIQDAKQRADELAALFEADQTERAAEPENRQEATAVSM